MNLSETAFLHPVVDGFALRWFTPTIEVDLCGHATLASAHVLWEDGYLAPEATARFHTKSGLLTADQASGWIELDFPATRAQPVPAPDGIDVTLGADVHWVGRTQFDYLIELESEAAIRRLQPDLAAIARLPIRGLMVTSRAGSSEFDFVSRFFAPASGVDEDPVTGSAHCALGPFWSERLGKSAMLAYQASSRGGIVRVRVEGERVKLSGQAVTTLRGELVRG
jgi:PhzF family phenazine biosynthesis protein